MIKLNRLNRISHCGLCKRIIHGEGKGSLQPTALCMLCGRTFGFYLEYLHEAWGMGYFPSLSRMTYDLGLTGAFSKDRFLGILLELQRYTQITLVRYNEEIIRIYPYVSGYSAPIFTKEAIQSEP